MWRLPSTSTRIFCPLQRTQLVKSLSGRMSTLKMTAFPPLPAIQRRAYSRGKYMDAPNDDDEFNVVPSGESDLSAVGGARMNFLSEEMKADNLLNISSLSAAGFRLADGSFLCGPIAVFPKTALSWRVITPEHITPESLELFFLLQPKLDILIIGVGDKEHIHSVRQRVAPTIAKHRIGYEILDSEDAAALFNFMNGEHRYVAAALYPPQELHVGPLEFASTLQQFREFDQIDTDPFRLRAIMDTYEAGGDHDFELRSACYRVWGFRTEKAQEMLKRIVALRQANEDRRFERLEAKIEKEQMGRFLEAKRRAKELDALEEESRNVQKVQSGERVPVPGQKAKAVDDGKKGKK